MNLILFLFSDRIYRIVRIFLPAPALRDRRKDAIHFGKFLFLFGDSQYFSILLILLILSKIQSYAIIQASDAATFPTSAAPTGDIDDRLFRTCALLSLIQPGGH
jgi:hypothetical protein